MHSHFAVTDLTGFATTHDPAIWVTITSFPPIMFGLFGCICVQGIVLQAVGYQCDCVCPAKGEDALPPSASLEAKDCVTLDLLHKEKNKVAKQASAAGTMTLAHCCVRSVSDFA